MRHMAKTMMSGLLALGLTASASAFQEVAPPPTPAPPNSPDNPDKPSQPEKPTKPGPRQGQVAIGVIQRVNPKQRTVTIQPRQGQQIQTQQAAPGGEQGTKLDEAGLLTLTVDDETVIQLADAKGFVTRAEEAREPESNEKPKPRPDQGGKPKPRADQEAKEKEKPKPRPIQAQLTQLQVGQLVRVVHQQQEGKPRATQIRVLQTQQSSPRDER